MNIVCKKGISWTQEVESVFLSKCRGWKLVICSLSSKRRGLYLEKKMQGRNERMSERQWENRKTSFGT